VWYRDETGNLVTETLGGDGGHLVADHLVGIEVQSETKRERKNVSYTCWLCTEERVGVVVAMLM
jgi:hypothetical protein